MFKGVKFKISLVHCTLLRDLDFHDYDYSWNALKRIWTVYHYSWYFTNNPIAPYWFTHNMTSYIRRLDRKHHFTCSTHPRIDIDTETSIFYVKSFRPQSLSKIHIFPYNLGRLIYDDTNEEIWSNFYSFRECVHSPLTEGHFRDPIPRRRKIDFEGRGREYGISECVQGIFVVHRSSNDNIGHIFMCRYWILHSRPKIFLRSLWVGFANTTDFFVKKSRLSMLASIKAVLHHHIHLPIVDTIVV